MYIRNCSRVFALPFLNWLCLVEPDKYTVELVQSAEAWVFQHPMTSDKNLWSHLVFLLTKIKLSILTSCIIWHISLDPWYVGLDRFHCTSIDLIYSFIVGKTKTIEAPPIVVPARIYGGNGSVGDLHIIWTVSDQIKIRLVFNASFSNISCRLKLDVCFIFF